MTKERLSQLAALNREITLDRQRLNALAARKCAGQVAGLPHLDLIGNRLPALEASYRLLEEKAVRALQEYNRLLRFIMSVEDAQMRLILSLRYIDGLSWIQVAFRIGETDESYPRRKHDLFLRKNRSEKRVLVS